MNTQHLYKAVAKTTKLSLANYLNSGICPKCYGSGTDSIGNTCGRCNGSGSV